MNFNGMCKFCNHEMELIDQYNNKYTDIDTYIYWCSYCGAVLDWYEEYPIQDDDWREPIMTRSYV